MNKLGKMTMPAMMLAVVSGCSALDQRDGVEPAAGSDREKREIVIVPRVGHPSYVPVPERADGSEKEREEVCKSLAGIQEEAFREAVKNECLIAVGAYSQMMAQYPHGIPMGLMDWYGRAMSDVKKALEAQDNNLISLEELRNPQEIRACFREKIKRVNDGLEMGDSFWGYSVGSSVEKWKEEDTFGYVMAGCLMDPPNTDNLEDGEMPYENAFEDAYIQEVMKWVRQNL